MHTIPRLLGLAAITAMSAGSVLAEGTMDDHHRAIEMQNRMSAESALLGAGPTKLPTEPQTEAETVADTPDQRDLVGMPLDDPRADANPVGNNHIIDVDEPVLPENPVPQAQIPPAMTVDGRMDGTD